jgi:hypothetical protein
MTTLKLNHRGRIIYLNPDGNDGGEGLDEGLYDCGKDVFLDEWMCTASADHKDIVGSLLVLLTVTSVEPSVFLRG